jgi:hypothetical protein
MFFTGPKPSIRIRKAPPAATAAPVQSKAARREPGAPEFGGHHLSQYSIDAADVSPAAQLQTEPRLPRNKTGLPDKLKSGIESLSGISLDNVKVHYNSSQPRQLNALAYTQGSNIHVARGQERHLPHEAWHVVQQAQGRVQPTMQMNGGIPVNDDQGLEFEADVMGAKALANAPHLQKAPEDLGSLKAHAHVSTCSPVAAQLRPHPPGEPDTHNFYNAQPSAKRTAWNGTKPTFGANLYDAVVSEHQGGSGRTITVRTPQGVAPVVRETVQLDHQPSWAYRVQEFTAQGTRLDSDPSAQTSPLVTQGIYIRDNLGKYAITTYGARMYYNDFGSLAPSRGGENASGGSSGVLASEPTGNLHNEALRDLALRTVNNYVGHFNGALNEEELSQENIVSGIGQLRDALLYFSGQLRGEH